MRTLREIHSDSAVVQVSTPAGVALWTAPLLGAAAALPWLAGSPPSYAWAYPLALGTVLAVAAVAVRSRRVRVPLRPDSTLALEATDCSEDPAYRVLLRRADERVVLLDNPSLESLLRDLGHLLEVTSLSLEDPSCIDPRYLRKSAGGLPAASRPAVIGSKRTHSGLRVIRAVWGAAAFATLVFGWSLLNARTPVSTLSLILPVLAVSSIALLGVGLLRARVRVTVTPAGLRVDRWGLFRRRTVLEVAAPSLAGAILLDGARQQETGHVIVATTSGPRVITLDAEGAEQIAACIGRIAAPVGTEHVVETSGVIGALAVPASLRDSPSEGRGNRRPTHPEVARARQS
ncbi:MAG TPA: hypothetical protein VIM73_15495 [Polyangiaceae bacterium]